MTAAADLVIEALADENAELRALNHHLIDVLADLAFENAVIRMTRDAVTRRLQRELQKRLQRLDERRSS